MIADGGHIDLDEGETLHRDGLAGFRTELSRRRDAPIGNAGELRQAFEIRPAVPVEAAAGAHRLLLDVAGGPVALGGKFMPMTVCAMTLRTAFWSVQAWAWRRYFSAEAVG